MFNCRVTLHNIRFLFISSIMGFFSSKFWKKDKKINHQRWCDTKINGATGIPRTTVPEAPWNIGDLVQYCIFYSSWCAWLSTSMGWNLCHHISNTRGMACISLQWLIFLHRQRMLRVFRFHLWCDVLLSCTFSETHLLYFTITNGLFRSTMWYHVVQNQE